MKPISIGKVAEKTGLTIATIRYYEAEGLLPKAERLANNRRTYGEDVVDQISFIQSCKAAGFALADIKAMFTLKQVAAQPCQDAQHIAARALRELSRRISEMQAARKTLSKLMSECSAVQCGPKARDCSMLKPFAGGH